MLKIAFQRDPLSGEGARLYGGRWNRVGTEALYLAADHTTAIAEYYQDYVMQGTLAAYDVASDHIADLTNADGPHGDRIRDAVQCAWARMARIERQDPPGWRLADELIAAGADGALVPSRQTQSGVNLVLWRWSMDGTIGARVSVVDPWSELR